MKAILLIIGIFITGSVFATEPTISPLPGFIQNLSDADYSVWAQWQNRQVQRRAVEITTNSLVPEYLDADRTVIRSGSRSDTNATVNQRSQSYSDARTRRGDGYSDRRGSRITNSNTVANASTRQVGGTVITSYQTRYRNPAYTGAGTVRSYNPWVRFTGGEGFPEWDTLFVPCKEGTVTLQELLDSLIGPRNPERVFTGRMKGYFGG